VSGARSRSPASPSGDTGAPSLRQSVLDRLLADQAAKGYAGSATARARRGTPSGLRRALERDLGMLLSTRQCHVEWPQHLDAVTTSSWNYGIADYSGQSLTPRHIQEEFRQSIEHAIKTFEPRLRRVKVSLSDPASAPDRRLRFKIEAVMSLDSEPVIFETALDPVTHDVTVQATAGK
jgi:type VI secretion system protein ImpF